MATLTLTQSTWLKTTTGQAAKLDVTEKRLITPGSYALANYEDAPHSHVLVEFDPKEPNLVTLTPGGPLRWYVFGPHVKIVGNVPLNNPQEQPPAKVEPKGIITIAGVGPRALNTAIDGCHHFTWAEATRNGTRLPEHEENGRAIVHVAHALEGVRVKLGNRKIFVTSWYRPPAVNRAVGGAAGSRHVVGDAVDFAVHGMTPAEVFEALDDWWGGRGGLAYGVGFTHIDMRGYRARWTYPGV